MKVYFENDSHSFPKGGKKDGIVFCYYRQKDLCTARKYIPIPALPQNTNIINLEKITLSIWHNLPLRFKNNLSSYAKQYKTEYPDLRRKYLNSYGIFLKIIHKIDRYYSFSKQVDPSYSMYALLFGHLSVADFIKWGFLLPVKNSYKFNDRIILQVPSIDFFTPEKLISVDLVPSPIKLSKPG